MKTLAQLIEATRQLLANYDQLTEEEIDDKMNAISEASEPFLGAQWWEESPHIENIIDCVGGTGAMTTREVLEYDLQVFCTIQQKAVLIASHMERAAEEIAKASEVWDSVQDAAANDYLNGIGEKTYPFQASLEEVPAIIKAYAAALKGEGGKA